MKSNYIGNFGEILLTFNVVNSFISIGNMPGNKNEQIKDRVKEIKPGRRFTLTVRPDNGQYALHFNFQKVPTSNISSEVIDDLAAKIYEILSDVLKDVPLVNVKRDFSQLVSLFAVPSHPISVSRIKFKASIDAPHISGIAKNISKCEMLFIENTRHIEGGVLDLLNIQTNALVFESDPAKWCHIVGRHLRNGKDMLQCQEDLIDAGLEEFANL